MKTDVSLQAALAEAVGAEVRLEPVSERETRIFTPFQFQDGDHLSIRLRSQQGDRFEFTDHGHTFMHLSYAMDIDALESGNRGRLLEQVLKRHGVEDRDGELVLPTRAALLGPSLLTFIQALVQVTDLRYLSREVVRSTFLDDFRTLFSEAFGDHAHFDYVDPDHDPKGDYPIDCLLNNRPRPVAVFALPNDDACLLATITILKYRTWNRRLFSTGIHEDQEARNRRAVARFSDAADKQFSTLAGQHSEIVNYLEEQVADTIELPRAT